MKKIFLTGASSIFGSNLLALERKKYEFHCLLNSKKLKCNDIYKYKKIKINYKNLNNLIFKIKPDIIIHSAAIADIDRCEKNIKLCSEINIYYTKYLVKIAKKYNIKLIFISSDQIYNGKKNSYNEKNKTTPINEYGKSKVIAENLIKKYLVNYLIIRTNFYGVGTRNKITFSEFVLLSLKKNKKVNLFNDVFFNPLYLPNLIKYIFKLIAIDQKGTFNIASDGSLSKLQLALSIAKKFKLNTKLIKSISVKDINLYAERPNYMCLDNTKIKKALNLKRIKSDIQINQYLTNVLKLKNEINRII